MSQVAVVACSNFANRGRIEFVGSQKAAVDLSQTGHTLRS
jgi:hypothetical protein